MAEFVSGVFVLYLGLFLLPECTWGSVFLDPARAHSVLSSDRVLVRTRRANSFLEELRTGNLERECVEEKCSYEEARELFPQRQQLEAFWTRYQAGDPCDSAPCQNGATCTRLVHSFACKCAPGYHGHHCDKVRSSSSSSSSPCRHRNGGCEHFCTDGAERQSCSCADGYRLQRDNASCSPTVDVPCGRPQVFFAPRVVNGQVCPRGYCPWQALLMENHEFICGAVLLSPRWVLTAAHCVFPKLGSVFHVTVGEHDRLVPEPSEQKRRVVEVLVNPDYNRTSSDSDLALLRLVRDVKLGRLVIPVCLPGPREAEVDLTSGLVRTLASVRVSTVSGWGRVAQYGQASNVLQRVNVPRVRTLDCRSHTRLNISRNMLCFGLRSGGQDSCEGDSGGPLVTRFKKTWFLTGIVSWGRGCGDKNQYGVYTRVPNYLSWIHTAMEGGAKGGGAKTKGGARAEGGGNRTEGGGAKVEEGAMEGGAKTKGGARAEGGGNRTEGGGAKVEGGAMEGGAKTKGGARVEGGGNRTEGGGAKVEGGAMEGGAKAVGGARVEGGGARTERGGNRTEGGVRIEGGGNRTDGGGAKVEGGVRKEGGGNRTEGGGAMAKGGARVEGGVRREGGGNRTEGGGAMAKGGARVEGGVRIEGGGNKTEGGGNRTEGGVRIEGGGNKTEGGGNRMEGGGNRMEGGRNRTEGGVRIEGGGNKTEGGGNRTEGGAAKI